jgi:peroxiredoxin
MKNVAELIWLDTPTKEDAAGDESAPATSDGVQEPLAAVSETNASVFQIVLSEGARVSVIPQSVDLNALRGSHPQLGDCSLDWANIRSISLGNTIRLDASRGRYSKWKLQNAPDPKYMNEDEPANDRPNDTPQMRLVGKPAPDFDIKRLDGTPCQLSDFEGKILILDFWASWCGPCIRSMPQWIEISRQYVDAGVEVVFINLEEDEERIRRFLEKMELNPTVAMDSEGSVSKQYAVQAIPQTVIIDREGVITEILVGASEENEKTLRNTLDRLTGRVSN